MPALSVSKLNIKQLYVECIVLDYNRNAIIKMIYFTTDLDEPTDNCPNGSSSHIIKDVIITLGCVIGFVFMVIVITGCICRYCTQRLKAQRLQNMPKDEFDRILQEIRDARESLKGVDPNKEKAFIQETRKVINTYRGIIKVDCPEESNL